MVDYSGLTKAQVLAALWNGSHMQGLSWLGSTGRTTMSFEDAQDIIDGRGDLYFDYLEGRVLKIDLRSDDHQFDERLYDRDCGTGAAQRIIDALKRSLDEGVKSRTL